MPAAMDNQRFYKSSGGNAIMDRRNFSPDVVDYLSMETRFLRGVLGTRKYRYVVELGCDMARCFEVVDDCGVEYLGIDIREELLAAVAKHFATRRESFPRLIIGSADDLDLHLGAAGVGVRDGVLCVFPFNLLGNIEFPETILVKYNRLGVDVLVSGFSASGGATEVRRTYYEKCSIAALRKLSTPEGEVFTNFSSFHSIAYHENVLVNKLRWAGYSPVSRSLTNIGTITHAVAQANLPGARMSARNS
jgi:hypothetical protein